MPRDVSWLSLVQRADPDHARVSRYVIEYEFTAHGRGDERTHEGGMRVFRGNYDQRGPYRPETPTGLSWDVRSMDWNGIPLDWNQGSSEGLIVEMNWDGEPMRWDGDDLSWGT